MTHIAKPRFQHPLLGTNELGLSRRDYEGTMSTLCAGCGHNAISERIIHACFEMGIDPDRVVKLSGIGCSSKSPAYFLGSVAVLRRTRAGAEPAPEAPAPSHA